MAKKNCIPYGSDVSAGQFECADCGYILTITSVPSLPPCPMIRSRPHILKCWKCLSGQGDAPEDPYPNGKTLSFLNNFQNNNRDGKTLSFLNNFLNNNK